MKKMLLSLVAILFLTSVVLADMRVESVIIATDASNIDATVASVAGHKAGMTVLITENSEVDTDLISKLVHYNTTNVIIVGGPIVVSENTESQLNSSFSVVRLWGIQRTQTSLEVAKYFWTEGADCAVLVDDTKNSDADYKLARPAAKLAINNMCPLIPIPKGESVPVEVLTTLSDLSVKKVYFVSDTDSQLVRDALQNFTLQVFVGKHSDLEERFENKTMEGKLKLVVVAAPDWRLAIGLSAHTRDNTVVRFVENNSVDAVIALIKEKNITDVRVVGKPDRAELVASLLRAAGINVTKVSGENAKKISEDLLNKTKEEWSEKRQNEKTKLEGLKTRIRQKLLDKIEKAEQKIDEREQEIEGDLSEAASVVKQKIDLAREKISEANKTYDLENAKRLMSISLSNIDKARFKLNINMSNEVENEEGDQAKISARIDTLAEKRKLDLLNPECRAKVEALLNRSEELKFQAYSKKGLEAALLIKQSNSAFMTAKVTANICMKGEKLSDKLNKVLERQDKRFNIRANMTVNANKGLNVNSNLDLNARTIGGY